MQRGSGPFTASLSTWILPLVGERKPAIAFKSVVLPQPDGPSRQTNSPSATSRLIFSRTGVLLPSRLNVIPTFSTDSLVFGAGATTLSFSNATNPPNNPSGTI